MLCSCFAISSSKVYDTHHCDDKNGNNILENHTEDGIKGPSMLEGPIFDAVVEVGQPVKVEVFETDRLDSTKEEER